MKDFKAIYVDPLVPTVSEPIRGISVGSFRRRLTVAEKVLINTSDDPIIPVLKEDLFSSSFVDLDSDQLHKGLDYLTSVGILLVGRKEELLVDGIPEETP